MSSQAFATLNSLSAARMTEPRLETPRVLVVDDEAGVCQLLGEVLSRQGYDCRTRLNGDEALAALEQSAADVVVADLRMPGISGLDLLTQVHARHPQIAFLMITGENDIRVGIEAMKRGAADYLLKPFQIESVVGSVERALRLKRLENDLEGRRKSLEALVEDRTEKLRSAVERVEQSYEEIIEVLGAALDARDDETAGHAVRVTRYSLEMASSLGYSDAELDVLARAAYLHDIGKIGIPDAILLKQGKLTPQERLVMQAHVQIGYNLVGRVAVMAPAAEIILCHHERYDGNGYPRGIKGDAIPLGSRIFAVADTLDAMTSDRPYRRAMPFKAARAEITQESGRQFDPRIVEAFLGFPEEAWQSIRQEVATLRGETRHDVPKMSVIWHRWGRRTAAEAVNG